MKFSYRLLIWIILIFITIPPVMGQSTFTPVYNPTLTVNPVEGKIKIDGELDDSGWKTAALADNFVEHNPGDQTKPPVETIAYIAYDADNIYVAFKCYDDPAAVRASFSERERFYGSDDNVGFFLETSGNGLWAYTMNCNPYGIQGDALWSRNQGEDGSYDLIWESAGKLTDFGYQVEMAIPFSSLRFPSAEEQTWKVDFYRNHPREVHREYSWAAYDRDESCWPCQWGTVNGIKNVQSGKGLEILPSILTYQSGRRMSFDKFDNGNPNAQISLGTKYSIASNITAEVTINPDFSQVESDATQIDVNSTTALFYNEKRPFFQEGSDLFRSFYTVMYTRSINDPIYAAKLIGRMGRTNIAYLSALDEHSPVILPFAENSAILQNGKSFSNVVSLKQSVGEASQINGLLASRFMEKGGSGTLFSTMGDIRLNKNIYLQWQTIGSYTDEPDDTSITAGINQVTFDDGKYTAAYDGESYFGHALLGSTGYFSRIFTFDATYYETSPTFRADIGFEPTNDYRKMTLTARSNIDLKNKVLRRIELALSPGKKWNFDGQTKDQWVRADLELGFRAAQLETHSQYMRSRESFGGIQFDDMWNFHTCLHSRPNRYLAAGGSFNYGHNIARRFLLMSKILSLSAWLDIHPIDRLLLETSISFTKANEINSDLELYSGYTIWSRLNYQFSRALSARLLVQYDDFSKCWEIDPMLTYRISSFSVFYFGSTNDVEKFQLMDEPDNQWKLSSRQFFMKLQYLFQI